MSFSHWYSRAAMATALFALPVAASADLPNFDLESLGSMPASGFITGILQTPDPTDDRLFVVARNGNIYIHQDDSFISTPFLTVSVTQSGEGGLLSMAFHPEYGQGSDYLFVSYTQSGGDLVIARYEVDESDPNLVDTGTRAELLVVEQDAANHNGGQIHFGADGYLYIGNGDGGGGNDPNCRSQDMSNLLGKMLRIDVDQNTETAPFYGIPADNPFVGDAAIPDEIWASGLRNPWRFSFDMTTGELYIADVGQGAWEEINLVDPTADAGANFGWPVKEGLSCNGATNIFEPACDAANVTLPECSDTSLFDPIYVYPISGVPDCAITGGYVYRGTSIPSLQGWYVFGDYCSGRIWALDPNDPSSAPEIFQLDSGFSLTTFGQDRSGEIYVNSGNEVLRLVSDEEATGITTDVWQIYQ